MDIGSLVRLSETAKIQYCIDTNKRVFGVILGTVNLRESLDIPDDEVGYEVLLPGGIHIFYNSDIHEVIP